MSLIELRRYGRGRCRSRGRSRGRCALQAVAVGVLLHRLLDRVGALEELGAILLLLGSAVGIEVLVEKLPHVVGQAQNLEVLGVLESTLELLGNGSVVFGLPHDLADQPLLAVQVIVVELLVELLEE